MQVLEQQVNATRPRKKKRVQISPNSKFADVEAIYRAQIEAGDKDDSMAKSGDPELPSEQEDCIVVASKRVELSDWRKGLFLVVGFWGVCKRGGGAEVGEGRYGIRQGRKETGVTQGYGFNFRNRLVLRVRDRPSAAFLTGSSQEPSLEETHLSIDDFTF